MSLAISTCVGHPRLAPRPNVIALFMREVFAPSSRPRAILIKPALDHVEVLELERHRRAIAPPVSSRPIEPNDECPVFGLAIAERTVANPPKTAASAPGCFVRFREADQGARSPGWAPSSRDLGGRWRARRFRRPTFRSGHSRQWRPLRLSGPCQRLRRPLACSACMFAQWREPSKRVAAAFQGKLAPLFEMPQPGMAIGSVIAACFGHSGKARSLYRPFLGPQPFIYARLDSPRRTCRRPRSRHGTPGNWLAVRR